MFKACCQLCKYAREDIPLTIYYAFKQSETDDNDATASTGWETMLSAIIRAGFSIVGTWPMRTERSTGLKASVNALASSIVLVCRKRAPDAGKCTRREFINALHRELRPALIKLQSANIAPVDLAQSAIGPGIGVFSRYQERIGERRQAHVRARRPADHQSGTGRLLQRTGGRVGPRFPLLRGTVQPVRLQQPSSSATRTYSPAPRTPACRRSPTAACSPPLRGRCVCCPARRRLRPSAGAKSACGS